MPTLASLVEKVGIRSRVKMFRLMLPRRGPKTLPAHRLAGVRKRDARSSSRRGPPRELPMKGAHPLQNPRSNPTL
jgi:hypothetical protein